MFQNFHDRENLSYIDTLTHTWTLSPTYSFGEYKNIKFWVPLAFNYTDVGSDKYTTAFTAYPNLFHRLSQAWGYSLEMRLARRYGWTPQLFAQFFDYTSRDIGGSLGLFYFFGDKGGYLQARLNYDHVSAQGSNNDASSYYFLASGEYPLTADLKFSLYLRLGMTPYEHLFFNGPVAVSPKRLDKTLLFGSTITYRIYKVFSANLHYYVRRQDSNIGIYDYVSHIIGVQLAYRY